MNENMPKVSIIVPVYNVEKYLRQCIESIINQTYKNLEIILIDDGSTDNSAKIIKEYQEKEPRIVSIYQNNFGAPCARNKGIEIATGEYFMFFDSDDVLHEKAIENMLNNIEDSDLIMGNYCVSDEKGEVKYSYSAFKNDIYEKTNIGEVLYFPPFPCNKLYKSSIIKENRIFFDNVRIAQDVNFYLKFVAFANKINTISEYILNYRITSNSISRTYDLNILDIVKSIELAERYINMNINDKDKISLLNELNGVKIVHYNEQLIKTKNYQRIYRKLIYSYFYTELKKVDDSYCNKETKTLYKKVINICKLRRYFG